MSDVIKLSERDLDVLAERVASRVLHALRPGDGEPTPEARGATAQLLTKGELANALRRSTPTIDRWATEGMPFVDMGTYRLFDLATCRAWVAARPKPGRPVKCAAPEAPPATLPGVELRTRKRRT